MALNAVFIRFIQTVWLVRLMTMDYTYIGEKNGNSSHLLFGEMKRWWNSDRRMLYLSNNKTTKGRSVWVQWESSLNWPPLHWKSYCNARNDYILFCSVASMPTNSYINNLNAIRMCVCVWKMNEDKIINTPCGEYTHIEW